MNRLLLAVALLFAGCASRSEPAPPRHPAHPAHPEMHPWCSAAMLTDDASHDRTSVDNTTRRVMGVLGQSALLGCPGVDGVGISVAMFAPVLMGDDTIAYHGAPIGDDDTTHVISVTLKP